MDYQDYKQILMDEMWKIKPQEVSEYNIQSVVKQNRLSDGITPVYQDGGNLAPVIYLEQYYHFDVTRAEISELARELTERITAAHKVQNNFDIAAITPENAREHLTLRMYNRAMNPELERECAHIDCLDLMAVPRWELQTPDGDRASFAVNRNVQRTLLHMTDGELLQIARENTMQQQFTIRTMSDILREKIKEVPEEVVSEMLPTDAADEVMFVMTNAQEEYGAAAVLFPEKMKAASAVIGEKDFYVVPSSIHELVIVPGSRVDNPADLLGMMQQINADQVSEQDRLGMDNIYRFDGHKLHICNTLDEAIAQTAPLQPENRAMTQRRTL